LAEAIAKRRLEGDLDAVPASWTIGAKEDGSAQHQRCLRMPDHDLWSACGPRSRRQQ